MTNIPLQFLDMAYRREHRCFTVLEMNTSGDLSDELMLVASQAFEINDDKLEEQVELFMIASQSYKENQEVENKVTGYSSRFGKTVSNEELKSLRESAVPSNTKKSTTWASKVWSDWVTERCKDGCVEK